MARAIIKPMIKRIKILENEIADIEWLLGCPSFEVSEDNPDNIMPIFNDGILEIDDTMIDNAIYELERLIEMAGDEFLGWCPAKSNEWHNEQIIKYKAEVKIIRSIIRKLRKEVK